MKKDIPSWFFDRTKKQFSERKALLQKQSKIVFVGVTDTVTEWARHIYGDLINADFETQYNWFNENVFRPELFIGERDDIRWKLGASIGFNAMRGNLVVSAAEYWSLSKGLRRLNRLGELLGYSYAVILAGKKPKLRDLPKGWQAFDNVFFVGELDQEKLRELFLAADIVVSASKAETFGLTLAEAMACGTPAVACDGFGAEEVAGVLYNEIFGKELPEIDGDLPVLADIIGEYCALPRNETEDVCLNTARKYFSKQAAKEKIEQRIIV
jgi:glycosyltransferase involved in cell wall biosynthesis